MLLVHMGPFVLISILSISIYTEIRRATGEEMQFNDRKASSTSWANFSRKFIIRKAGSENIDCTTNTVQNPLLGNNSNR